VAGQEEQREEKEKRKRKKKRRERCGRGGAEAGSERMARGRDGEGAAQAADEAGNDRDGMNGRSGGCRVGLRSCVAIAHARVAPMTVPLTSGWPE
jgi:hypothetical protein